MIISFTDWLAEGVDFKENFTPLYHITSFLDTIIESDMLKVGRPSRGPRGVCVTRSKFFEDPYGDWRIILNAEELRKHGYRSYPLDEWALSEPTVNPPDDKTTQDWHPLPPKPDKKWVTRRQDWPNRSAIRYNQMGKSNFGAIHLRPISHRISTLSHVDKSKGLEVEYEERIIKDIVRVGRFIHGINQISHGDEWKWSKLQGLLTMYLTKYPHIKFYTGRSFLKEVDMKELFK
jgi:hypothetical protein